MMGSKYFKPEDGKTYKNRNGEEYVCVRTDGGESVMVRFGDADGDAWMVKVMFCRIYDDGTIDWQTSRDGAFLSAAETREIRKNIEYRTAERRAREFKTAARDFRKAAQECKKAAQECKKAAQKFKKAAQEVGNVKPGRCEKTDNTAAV